MHLLVCYPMQDKSRDLATTYLASSGEPVKVGYSCPKIFMKELSCLG
jgi:hypothetical protein